MIDQSKIQAAADKDYFIKPNYQIRPEPIYFVDQTPVIYQPHMYRLAAALAERLNCRYIIDIGCGTAGKLTELYPQFEVVGIDYGVNIEECRAHYPYGMWIEHDLDRPELLSLPDEVVCEAVVICSDVIEHMKNPGYLLSNIKALLQKAPLCLLSTPERDAVRGADHAGPPPNIAHVREWNRVELTELMKHFELNQAHIGLTAGNNQDWSRVTMVSVLVQDDFEKRFPALPPDALREAVESRLCGLELTQEEFLQLVFSPEQRQELVFACMKWIDGHRVAVNEISGPFGATAQSLLTQYAAQGYSLFVRLKPKGTPAHRMRMVFLDMPCSGAPQDVPEEKKHLLRQIRSCRYPPSLLVETDRGYQAYWLLKPGLNRFFYGFCLYRLAREVGLGQLHLLADEDELWAHWPTFRPPSGDGLPEWVTVKEARDRRYEAMHFWLASAAAWWRPLKRYWEHKRTAVRR